MTHVRTTRPLALIALFAAGLVMTTEAEGPSPSESLSRLKAGNATFVANASLAQGHGEQANEPTSAAARDAKTAEVKQTVKTTPKAASAAELDAVLARITQRIASRSSGVAARPTTTSRRAAAGQASAPKSWVKVEWRPSVVWPGQLKTFAGPAERDRVVLAWPALID